MEPTIIQQFYTNKTILVTGATGTLGTIIVEKLLRGCPGIKNILLPIRSKRNKSIEERISKYFNSKLFDKIKNENEDLLKKIIFINSNLDQKNCGINAEDYEFITSTTNILFHCAAGVEFSATLKSNVNCNIIVTMHVLQLAKNIRNLEAFVYASTLWSQMIEDYIEEKVYKPAYIPESLCRLVDDFDDEDIVKLTPSLLGKWPNTYVTTKNITEYLIEKEKESLPVSIFRIGGVISTYKEPEPGILPSIQAVSYLGIGGTLGIIKVIYTNKEFNMHLVPSDFVVNGIIVVAWKTATDKKKKQIMVYNHTPETNPISRKTYYDHFVNTKYPLENTIWTPGYVATNSKWLYDKYFFIYHTIPAHIWDLFLKLFNQKPVFTNIMKKNRLLLEACEAFIIPNFKFEYKNIPDLWNSITPADQKLFNFNLDTVDWDEMLHMHTKAIKIYLKEDMNNLQKCQQNLYFLRCKY